MQNRLDAFFKEITRDSEYSDRSATVFVAKHEKKKFHVVNAQTDVVIKNFLQTGCMNMNSVKNLRTK